MTENTSLCHAQTPTTLNTSEENGWKLHSWNFCDNSYNVTYVALMVRDTVSDSDEEAKGSI